MFEHFSEEVYFLFRVNSHVLVSIIGEFFEKIPEEPLPIIVAILFLLLNRGIPPEPLPPTAQHPTLALITLTRIIKPPAYTILPIPKHSSLTLFNSNPLPGLKLPITTGMQGIALVGQDDFMVDCFDLFGVADVDYVLLVVQFVEK